MNDINISFEVFPVRDPSKRDHFFDGVRAFQSYHPLFTSLTYGAGGSERLSSERLMEDLLRAEIPNLAGHLTAAGKTADYLRALARRWWDGGLRRIVALRGDAAAAGGGGLCAAGLVELLLTVAPFEISVACYPEGHPKSASPEAEMAHLKRKIDNGAARAITQFFFDPQLFLRFRDRCRRAGIEAPIVPGILPAANIDQTRRFAEACGATVPTLLLDRFHRLGDDKDAALELAIDAALELMAALRREGVGHFHLYTLNKYSLAETICQRFGVRPKTKEAA